jgi:16S rRNA (guanine527-N7)-methyltransferase
MTEAEARAWLVGNAGADPRALERLRRFVAILRAEAGRQNLVASSTWETLWSRHIVDSAQLLPLARDGAWLDLGTGAGFPGMVIAILAPGRAVTLIESRPLRSAFLRRVVDDLGLAHVVVEAERLERVATRPVDVISARAFAPLERLLTLAHRFSTDKTVWLLPKGRSARKEVESVRQTWHAAFHVEQSVTDPDSAVVVATGVRPRRPGGRAGT